MQKKVRNHIRTIMSIWLVIADSIALLSAGWLAIHIRSWLGASGIRYSQYYAVIPLLLIFFVAYLVSGMYPGVGMAPVDELRLSTIMTSMSVVLLAMIDFLTQTGISFSRLVFVFYWILALIFVPVNRLIFRKMGCVLGFWGEPFAIIGFGSQGRHIYNYLKQNPMYGFRPAIIVNGDIQLELGSDDKSDLEEIRATDLEKDNQILMSHGITSAIVVPTEISAALRDSLVDEYEFGLNKLILISSLNWTGGIAVVVHNIGGLLGFEIERNLLNPFQQMLKKIIDLFLLAFVGLAGFPVLLFCAVLIRLDSPGPLFFKHERIGKGGKKFLVWKFRTMVKNADEVLEDCLSENPQLRQEWEENHKLKDDPRVTRTGKLLRKTSLDELPQLINILKGEMSFVGPRPIVEEEVKFYENSFRLYTKVLPGLTGLWQVSGRSETTYDDRVSLDNYYIRHWSFWMDIYILFRTVWAVINRSGAY